MSYQLGKSLTFGGLPLVTTLLGKETSLGNLKPGDEFDRHDSSRGRVLGPCHWSDDRVYVWLNTEQKKMALMKTAKVFTL